MAYPQTETLTEMAVAFAGMDGGGENPRTEPAYNEEASAELAFGTFVKEGAVGGSVKKPSAITDILAGVVLHSHKHAIPEQLGDTGVKAGMPLNLRTEGAIWVPIEDSVVKDGPVFVRAVVAGSEVAGACRGTDDSTDMIEVSGWCRWLGDYTGPGFGKLYINTANRGA